jgi:tRNA threonylcarbamoyladenosine biosynthesis protein TsaE
VSGAHASDAGAAQGGPGVRLASGSPADTEALGVALGRLLAPGDLVMLIGPLGAGKTCFVTGLARGAGVRGRVRSPSFTLMHEYQGRQALVLHVDLYRLDPMDVDALGLDEALERGAVAVEWGEKLPAALRDEALCVRFEVSGADTRTLLAAAAGERAARSLALWREALATG